MDKIDKGNKSNKRNKGEGKINLRTLSNLFYRANRGNRNAALEGYALCVKLEKTRRYWALVRCAVKVRPYILHWLEVRAMRQEEYRIRQASNGIIEDWTLDSLTLKL